MANVDKLYYDITFSNRNQEETISNPVKFIETRSIPFLHNPSLYYMSIIRFSLDTDSLPVFIPVIQPKQPDINLTIYSISMSYKVAGVDVVVRTYIKFIPQNLIATLPTPPSQTVDGFQDDSSGYYYIYNYQAFIYMMNVAFEECYQELALQVGLLGGTLPTPHAPVMEFDSSDKFVVINGDIVGYASNLPNPIILYMNNNCGQLFASLPMFINANSSPQGLNFRIAFSVFGGSTQIDFPVSNPTYIAIQCWTEANVTAIWSPVQSVVFTSSLLPIVANQLSEPTILNNGANISSNGNNANFGQIITDMMVDQEVGWRPAILYNPTAEFRLVEMIGNVPLYSIDVDVYWKNRQGKLIAFRLVPGGCCTMKILFTRKKNLLIQDIGGTKFTH